MEFKDIKQWIVSADKLARPVNPFKHQIGKSRDFTVKLSDLDLYGEFKISAQQYTYAADLEPGIYEGDKVEAVKQCHPGSTIEVNGVTMCDMRWLLRLKQQTIVANDLNIGDIVLLKGHQVHIKSIEGKNTGDNQIEINDKIRLRKTEIVSLVKQQPKDPLTVNEYLNQGLERAISEYPGVNPNTNAIKVVSDRIDEIHVMLNRDSEFNVGSQSILNELNHILKLLQS